MLIKPICYFPLRKHCNWEIRRKKTYRWNQICVEEVLKDQLTREKVRKGERESKKEREGETCGREWEKEKYSFLKRKLQYSYIIVSEIFWGHLLFWGTGPGQALKCCVFTAFQEVSVIYLSSPSGLWILTL